MVRNIGVDDKALESSKDFVLIPDGAKVRVSVFAITEGTVKSGENQGKAQATWTAKVVEEGEFKGREIPYNNFPLYAGAKNGWVLTSFANAVGWPVNADDKTVGVPDNLGDVLGTEVVATIRQRESTKINPDTGKPYVNNTVGSVRKAKGASGGITEQAAKGWDQL